MSPKSKSCDNCKQSFIIDEQDFSFYEKIGVQEPKLCPLCRAQLRLSFRNERSFYKRDCDKCKKSVVSMYSPNKPYTVWCYECWFSDQWDSQNANALFRNDNDKSIPFEFTIEVLSVPGK